MAFKTADFKKTTRSAGDERMLYPYTIRDDRYTASIGYAIAYYERMVGRRRAEFEAETLLEFFGDARLARGLVATVDTGSLRRSLAAAILVMLGVGLVVAFTLSADAPVPENFWTRSLLESTTYTLASSSTAMPQGALNLPCPVPPKEPHSRSNS